MAEALLEETVAERDERYLGILLKALSVSAGYKPKFGKGGKVGLTSDEFEALHAADPFYHWIGLDSPLLYAAHKAAGGITSVYRQVGRGCELIIRKVLEEEFGMTEEEARWEYSVPTPDGGSRTLALDGRIDLEFIRRADAKRRFETWLDQARKEVGVADEVTLKGTVFETRQGYKSKDAKRQNADIANAASAYANAYLPTLIMLSTQLDSDIAVRYRAAKWLILIGTVDPEASAVESTYAFARDALGFDLAAFFERVSDRVRMETEKILASLLAAE
ncbi:MAG: hypothetical protein ACRD3V_23910 [Vicinamibacteria bacterium]